jgi:hypothetical protein
MTITRDNYEPFFLDYLEGNLDENMIDQFLDFLEQNTDLKEELQLFENIHLPEEKVVFSDKKYLYKSVQEDKTVFELRSIAYMEGDMQVEERSSFEAYLANHPELEKEYNQFTKTRLIADTGIKYQHKQKLYQKTGSAILMNWVARAAAVVIILWGISSLLQTEVQPTSPTSIHEIASVKPQSVIPDRKIESAKTNPKTNTYDKNITSKKVYKQLNIKSKSISISPVKKPAVNTVLPERELSQLEQISPIIAQLEVGKQQNHLAISRSINTEKINDPRNIMNVEEFLASRAKKMGDEGLLSLQRIFRTGLTVASELSGNRIGYNVKNGKVSSIGFESKLMAFSIPLEKK